MKFSWVQIVYTLMLWLCIVMGALMLIDGRAIGWLYVGWGVLMGILRTIRDHNLDMRVTEEKDGGEDDV